MPSRLEILVDLLHSQDTAALATQSATLPGYPFASSVPFAADERHRPLLLISSLAEHTRNLATNPKAGLLLARSLGGGETARVSLVGEVAPLDAGPQCVARYLRYHPEAERFLQLGDFRFHRFEPERVLVVGGFAQAGWLEGKALHDAPSLPLEAEATLLATQQPLPTAIEILGIDRYGIDLREHGVRRRLAFDAAPLASAELPAAVARHVATLAAAR